MYDAEASLIVARQTRVRRRFIPQRSAGSIFYATVTNGCHKWLSQTRRLAVAVAADGQPVFEFTIRPASANRAGIRQPAVAVTRARLLAAHGPVQARAHSLGARHERAQSPPLDHQTHFYYLSLAHDPAPVAIAPNNGERGHCDLAGLVDAGLRAGFRIRIGVWPARVEALLQARAHLLLARQRLLCRHPGPNQCRCVAPPGGKQRRQPIPFSHNSMLQWRAHDR